MFDTSPVIGYIFLGIFIVVSIVFIWYNTTLKSESRFSGGELFGIIAFLVILTFFIYFVVCGVIGSTVYSTNDRYYTSKYTISDSKELCIVPGTINKYVEYTEQDPDCKYAYYFYCKDLNTNELVQYKYSVKNLIIIPVEEVTKPKAIKAINPNNYETYYKETRWTTKTYEKGKQPDSSCTILIVPLDSVVNID